MMSNGSSPRSILTAPGTGRGEIREIIETILIAELVAPSESLWLVSPWITDLEILDNRAGQFSSLVPNWEPRRILLSEVFAALALRSRVHVIARPVDHNQPFLRKMRDLAEAFEGDRRPHIATSETLHLKGLLGQDYYLSGSMNLTYGGLETNDEGITLVRDFETAAKMRLHFVSSYGAVK